MKTSPFNAYSHLKETICSYLETTYKIADEKVFEERAELLRQQGVISQEPYIETTPPFETGLLLKDLLRRYTPMLPLGLDELMSFGTAVDKLPLYKHQEKSLVSHFENSPNLIVATGTGSGKTECFLLPILARILKEAKNNWLSPTKLAVTSQYRNNQWLHSRAHETRQPAMRALILYPMNALVNDQVRRLRKILASTDSEKWQKNNINNNLIYFGMYTGDTDVTGHWKYDKKRQAWKRRLKEITETWDSLDDELKKSGGWSRPNGPEMLNRWDMQEAPPDILVTNYSMLEYMLVRPLEANIFNTTREWLISEPEAVFTLVLDEAHTYTGSQGTEVAHLIRRLKERLGIEKNSNKFRCIATSASLPNSPNAHKQITKFVSDLFDEKEETFTLITGKTIVFPVKDATPNISMLEAFSEFQNNFSFINPISAIRDLSNELGIVFDEQQNPKLQLYKVLRDNPLINKLRNLTARAAVQLNQIADCIWGDIGTEEQRKFATAGLLTAGTYATQEVGDNIPPLISSRVHMMFKGIPGLWACTDPNCSCIDSKYRSQNRPVGKLYVEPRVWCDCGSRVLEVFTCRVCGLMYLGGIPDNSGSLLPWSDSLEGEFQDYNNYEIFGVEPPCQDADTAFRSVKTSKIAGSDENDVRLIYTVDPLSDDIPFPKECPRCHNERNNFREIIEPLKTKGVKAFSVLLEDAFRLQPNLSSIPPNYGRKSLIFSDSRQEAAIIASDIEMSHNKDLFRQLVYRTLVSCEACNGYGEMEILDINNTSKMITQNCKKCNGTGLNDKPKAIPVPNLRNKIMNYALLSKIDPTRNEIENYFSHQTLYYNPKKHETEEYINAYLRDEISAPEFGLEPLGLASWKFILPPADEIAPLNVFNKSETEKLLQNIIRILATENTILPMNNNHQNWPNIVEIYHRKVIIGPDSPSATNYIRFNFTSKKKLGRYMRAVAKSLLNLNRLPNNMEVEDWLNEIQNQLFAYLIQNQILVLEVHRQGYGISIDQFQLEKISDEVNVCEKCGYISDTNLFNICLRCTNTTSSTSIRNLKNNYYRKFTQYSEPGSIEHDPFPINTKEHTGQIEKHVSRTYEKKFQELFLGSENRDDQRIDILSVTTTMEMGIDIGSILSVGLRNMPPYVANYQQRAGRAGRRGSGIATVITFAQNRSHDQYYFRQPKSIISDPPRVPVIYLDNEVIARRHVRALVLQYFFHQWSTTGSSIGESSNLFGAWGNISSFRNNYGIRDLRRWIDSNLTVLIDQCKKIVKDAFYPNVKRWIEEIPNEIQDETNPSYTWNSELLPLLANKGLLPKYAFPIDVVAFWPHRNSATDTLERGVQRDLTIALSEFAPGSEIIIDKKLYTVAGLYSPYNSQPNYIPKKKIVECRTCSAIKEIEIDDASYEKCYICDSSDIRIKEIIRPEGFCSDWNTSNNERRYRGGGRERAGYSSIARLGIGPNSFRQGQESSFSNKLFVLVKEDDLHVTNYGPNNQGFRICSKCGRKVDNPGERHKYPADIPPFVGYQQGPQAGTNCIGGQINNVVLAHKFRSEIIMLGVNLPTSLEANVSRPSGRAIWYSFGTLIQNAASIYLQINPDELQIGIRPIIDKNDQISGEVYLYDTLPGGSGYARDIYDYLPEIFELALNLSKKCSNPTCEGACYNCLYDYKNQKIHMFLDRSLGEAILDYVMNNKQPVLTPQQSDKALASIDSFLQSDWNKLPPERIGNYDFPAVYQNKISNERITILPIHTLQRYPDDISNFSSSNLRVVAAKEFDLIRRPFWVITEQLRL